jgi:flagellar protein FlaG
MNDSALSISTKALQPAYGRSDAASVRGSWGRAPATPPADDGTTPTPPALPPGSEAANAVATGWQANGLDKTQAVNPTQRAEQAANERVANEQAEQESPLAPPGKGELEKAVESINDFLQSSKRSLEFSVDETSGRTVIKVMDSERDEVIRQIPPETALELMQKLRDGDGVAATGLAEKA